LILEDNKNISIANELQFKNACCVYFNFAQTTFDNLFEDLQLFVMHSNNLLYKIRVILIKNRVKIGHLIKNISKKMYDFALESKKCLEYENLKGCYTNCSEKIMELKDLRLIHKFKKSFKVYQEWLEETYQNHLKHYPNLIINKFSSLPKDLHLYDNIYLPLKEFTVRTTSNTFDFIIDKSKASGKAVKELTYYITDFTKENYEYFRDEIILSKEALVKVEINKEKDIIVIQISRKLMIYNNQKCRELIEGLITRIKTLGEKTKEGTLYLKESLISKYRKFLDLFTKFDKDKESNGKSSSEEASKEVSSKADN